MKIIKYTILFKIAFFSLGSCVFAYADEPVMNFLDRHPPLIESKYYHFTDSDKTKIYSWQETGTVPVNKNLNWLASYTRSKYAEPNVITTFDNKFQTGLQYSKDDRTLEMQYGFRDFSNLKGSHVYKVSGSSAMGLLKSVSLTHEYDHWETAKAIQSNIKAYINSVNIYQPMGERWVSTTFYQHHEFNDNNTRDLIRQAILYRILRNVPELRLGYEYIYYDTRFHASQYWSPKSLSINQVKSMLAGQLWGSKWSYEFAYALGLAKQKGERDQRTNSASASIKYQITKSWQIFINFETEVAPTYKSKMVQGGLRHQF